MDQKKTGSFLQSLRKEKGLTQEELAERFAVSGRTISRWETGRNMPDISMLTEIADFFDVDVREIIEGERKNEMMDEELKDVADKMADYADMEKSRLCKWVQAVGFTGVALLTLSIALQAAHYETGGSGGFAIATSFAALIALAVTTLYANGFLTKLTDKKVFQRFIKVAVVVLVVISLKYILGMLFVAGYLLHGVFAPLGRVEGVQNYDKPKIMEKYASDLNSRMYLFPDSLDDYVEANYHQGLKEGIFDTDGYIFLEVKYNDSDFEAEKTRLSSVSNDVEAYTDQENHHHEAETKSVLYDTSTYNYPAYVANDGNGDAYEYALIDEQNDTIIYAALSYPQFYRMSKYSDYLKKDRSEYKTNDTFNSYTIYY